MGARVTQSGSGEIVRARRLKKALDSGASPSFVESGNALSTTPLSHKNKNKEQEDLEIQSLCLEELFQSAPDGIVIFDSSERILCVNEAFRRMFGYTANEAMGNEIVGLVVPPERQPESNWISERVRKGEKITLETQRRRKDGSYLEVAVSVTPLQTGGKPGAAYAVYRDISEQKKAQALSAALYRVAEESSAANNLQHLFAAVHSIVDKLIHAPNFCIALYDSDAELLCFPYFVDEREHAPAAGKLGHGLVEYILRTGEPLLATEKIVQRMQERGEIDRIENTVVDWIGVPLKAGDRTFGALAVRTYSESQRYSVRDKEILTFVSQQIASTIENKRNEQALRRSEARYRSLVQSSVYGIYRSSLEGKFLDVNPALIAMLGYDSAEEVLALEPRQDIFVNADEHVHLIEEFRRAGRMDGIEVKWRKKNRSAITVRISGRAVSSADEPADVLEAIAEDVTERRVLEDQFRQSQKMEAVGRLAGGVAHDFNNLLMVISGYTEVILGELDSQHPLQVKARAIQQASDRATTLTQQLLAFSRKQLLELKVVDINTIVEDMERLLRPLIGENIELVTNLAVDAGHTRADAGQLEQVLMNLVVNSKDAMPKGGRIVIKTGNAPFDGLHRGEQTFIRPGSYVMLSVSDNGLGMDKETQSRIFEPFFTTKEKGKGTGLGLSTVYGIIKQSGGYVTVQSEPGCGATFNIYLPRVEEAPESHGVAPASRTTAGGSETVLLVEDEESVRQLVRETLESKGYRVLEAENGDAGLAAATRHDGAIDLVITDVVMPEMGGYELAQKLVESRPNVKVLYLSGYTEDAIVSEGTIESGKAFLQKPFTLQSLSRKVREVLG